MAGELASQNPVSYQSPAYENITPSLDKDTEFGNINYRDPVQCESCSSNDVRSFLHDTEVPDNGIPKYIEIGQLSQVRRRTDCWFCWTLYHATRVILYDDDFLKAIEADEVLCLESTPRQFAMNLPLIRSSPCSSPCSQLDLMSRYDLYIPDDVVSPLWPWRVTLHDNRQDYNSRPKVRQYLESEFAAGCSFSLIRRWLDVCLEQHGERCSQSKSWDAGSMRVDLIDVTTRQIVTTDATERYLALSYVWGRSAATAASANGTVGRAASEHTTNRRRRLPEHVSQTIEDAIVVVKNLGERYLWVDAYCVPQSDSPARNYAIERMHAVYQCAFCTICAISSDSSETGLAGVSYPHHRRQQFRTHAGEETLVLDANGIWPDITNSVWMTRAWTLQESLLSRRRLCFGDCGVFMVCQRELFWDGMVLDASSDREPTELSTHGSDEMYGLPSELPFRPLPDGTWTWEIQRAILKDYTRRKLSHDSDILRALTGILKHMSDQTGLSLAFGLMMTESLQCLLWTAERAIAPLPRRVGYPSWSWLGWKGIADYDTWLERGPIDNTSSLQEPIYTLGGPRGMDGREYPGNHFVKVESADKLSTHNELLISGQLVLRSKVACFRLVTSYLNEFTEGSDTTWDLHYLNDAGPVLRLERDPYEFHTHEETTCRMRQAQTDGVFEFIMLQRRTETDIETGRSISDIHGDRVWMMALLRNEDGSAERLGLLDIEYDLWEAAKPYTTTVRLV